MEYYPPTHLSNLKDLSTIKEEVHRWHMALRRHYVGQDAEITKNLRTELARRVMMMQQEVQALESHHQQGVITEQYSFGLVALNRRWEEMRLSTEIWLRRQEERQDNSL